MYRVQALGIAAEIVVQLKDCCEQCEIAGSMRRKKNEVHDIEIVCVPKQNPSAQGDLFAESFERSPWFVKAVLSLGIKLKGDPNKGKYVRMRHENIDIDIFIASPENYGLIKFIRTGSAEWVRKQFIEMNKNGFYRCKDGHLWQGSTMIETPEEEDVFRTLQIRWTDPADREV